MLHNTRLTGKFVGLSLLLTLALVTALQANIRFYTIVQQVCNSYRVAVVMDKMTLTTEAGGGKTFDLMLQSRRNNFEEVMMVGYISAGQAIARTGEPVKTINITVVIPKADHMLIMTTADIGLVDRLRLGKVRSPEFMRQLQWN